MSNTTEAGWSTGLVPQSTPEHQAILSARRQALSADLTRILNGRAEIVWEVGCGHGHFLAAYAAAHPASLCIGIDMASDRIERATRKRDRAGLAALHFLRAEARLFLEVLPREVRFTQVFVLFPDPWPKLRHHKHRVMQPEFLSWIAARMTPAGRLYFRTDHEPYFEETVRVIANHPVWAAVDDVWPFEHETVFQSRASSHRSLIAMPATGDRSSLIS
jgi:tRNA (guanine-N7-)-methyltransferase